MACKIPNTLLEFAEQVTSRLLEHCIALQTNSATQGFACKIVAELYCIKVWLGGNKQDPESEGDAKIQRRVRSLLRKFEDICTWIPPEEIREEGGRLNKEQLGSTLQDSHGVQSEHERSYPSLFSLLHNPTSIPYGLESYASLGSLEDQALRIDFLRKFVKEDKYAKLPVQDVAEISPLEDYSPHIGHLYEAVSKHCLCQRSTEPEHPIIANVHLAWPDKRSSTDDSCSEEYSDSDDSSSGSSVADPTSSSDSSINFRILFLSHPHGPLPSEMLRWGDTRIAVSIHKRVIWKDRHVSSKKPQLIKEYKNGFCGLISRSSPEPVWHPLVVDEGQLRFKGPRRYSRTFQLDTPSVPLRDIIGLRREEFTDKKRFVLSYLLARAVWQYYDSDWMIRGWTKDAVHFMYQTRDDESGLFVDAPFLHTKPFTIDGQDEDEDAATRIHRFPKILALGIMLIEIILGTRIEDERTPESYVNDKLTVNADAIIAQDISKDKKRLVEYSEYLTNAIKFCANPKKVVKTLSTKNAQKQRESLYKHVVVPLCQHCELSFNKRLTIAAIKLPSSAVLSHQPPDQETEHESDTDDLQSHLLVPVQLEDRWRDNVGQGSRPALLPELFSEHASLNGAMAQSGYGTSEKWFSRLRVLNKVLRAKPGETDDQYKPVKVAVLDTGIREDYYTKHKNRIKEYRDYVTKDKDSPADISECNHGSQIVELVLQMFNLANIYVARVLEQEELHDDVKIEEAQSYVTKAISDATEIWKVDVIVMAFGFTQEHHASGMREAIGIARAKGILSFAAAGNYGNTEDIPFPAQLRRDVLCMFCTNAHATASHGLHPRPSKHVKYNLAILGEEVQLPGLDGSLSGTSMSTAIGAGLAARLIDFSRHIDCREHLGKEAFDLKSTDGMESVLVEMAGGPSGDGYFCIVPWKLLKHIKDEQSRESKREAICHAIKMALREKGK